MTVDIATGLVEQQQQAAAPEVSQAEHDARLVAQVRLATIAECQRWLEHSASTVARAAFLFPPEHRRSLLAGAAQYRSAANLLEALRA
jgi:hypothetical protein